MPRLAWAVARTIHQRATTMVAQWAALVGSSMMQWLPFVGRTDCDVPASGIQWSGPVQIVRTGSHVVSSMGYMALVLFAAHVSLNVVVVNALPIPALNGGRMVLKLWEALTGRHINRRLEDLLTNLTYRVLLLVMSFTFYTDMLAVIGL